MSQGRLTESRVDLREKAAEAGTRDVQREADRLALAEYAPPGVIIDDKMDIVQVRGRTAPYLELSPGEPSRNLLKLAREGLIGGLGKAIRTARQRNAVTQEGGFRIEDGGQLRDVTIKVIPFRSSSPEERYFLVLFEEARPGGSLKAMPKAARESTGKSPHWAAARTDSDQRVFAIARRRSCHHPGRVEGPRARRRKRAMRNWKLRKKSWSRPTKN